MQHRIILAAAALAAVLAVPAAAFATDKAVDDKSATAALDKDPIGGSTSQAVGGPNSREAAVGQIGGSTSTATGVGQAGVPESTSPMQSAIVGSPYCGEAAAKSKASKKDASSPKLPKHEAGDDVIPSKLPKGDDEGLEDELREQQEQLDRLTDLLNQMQQTRDDVIRSITGG